MCVMPQTQDFDGIEARCFDTLSTNIINAAARVQCREHHNRQGVVFFSLILFALCCVHVQLGALTDFDIFACYYQIYTQHRHFLASSAFSSIRAEWLHLIRQV